jgi:hypothetical protein
MGQGRCWNGPLLGAFIPFKIRFHGATFNSIPSSMASPGYTGGSLPRLFSQTNYGIVWR